MATFRCKKSRTKGDLYDPGSPGGTGKHMISQQHIVETMLKLTFLIPMTLNVPVRVDVPWMVDLSAGYFNLLETPLWQIDIASSQIAP